MSNDSTVKKCTQCGIEKPFDDFYKHSHGRHGLQPRCKTCFLQEQKGRPPKYYSAITEGSKICKECGIEKPVSDFGKHSRNNDGLQNRCFTCRAEYRKNNTEHTRIYSAERYMADPQRAYRETSDYQKRNPDKVRKWQHDRRARERNAEGTHTVQEMREQFDRQKGKCYWCNHKLIHPFTKEGGGRIANWDHVIPLVRGGRNDLSNLVWACEYCNTSKGSKLPSEWSGSNGKLL